VLRAVQVPGEDRSLAGQVGLDEARRYHLHHRCSWLHGPRRLLSLNHTLPWFVGVGWPAAQLKSLSYADICLEPLGRTHRPEPAVSRRVKPCLAWTSAAGGIAATTARPTRGRWPPWPPTQRARAASALRWRRWPRPVCWCRWWPRRGNGRV